MDTQIVQRPITPKPKPEKVAKVKRRKKKTGRQIVEIQLDMIVKEIVLARDNGCVCHPPKNGHSSVRQPGHLLSRKNKNTRWDLYCVNEQCSSCNLLHNLRPEYYFLWFIEKWDAGKLLEMSKSAREVAKFQDYELLELLEQLNQIRAKQIADPEFKPYFTQQEIMSGAWKTK